MGHAYDDDVPRPALASGAGAHDLAGEARRPHNDAETMLPLPSQEVDRHRFVMARVMIAIATLMVLTDGTLSLLARVPG